MTAVVMFAAGWILAGLIVSPALSIAFRGGRRSRKSSSLPVHRRW